MQGSATQNSYWNKYSSSDVSIILITDEKIFRETMTEKPTE